MSAELTKRHQKSFYVPRPTRTCRFYQAYFLSKYILRFEGFFPYLPNIMLLKTSESAIQLCMDILILEISNYFFLRPTYVKGGKKITLRNH